MTGRLKKTIVLILIAAMCLGLCACDTDLSTLLLMKKVSDAATKTESFEGEFDCRAKASYGVLPLTLAVDGDIKGRTKDMLLELDMDIELGLLGDLEGRIFLEADDKGIDVYTGIEDLGGKMNWTHSRVDTPDGKKLDAKGMLGLFDSGSDILTKGNERKINGVEAVKLTLSLPGDMIAVAAGIESGTMDDLIIDVWVNKTDGHIVRIETELGGLAKLVVGSAAGAVADKLEIKEMPVVVDVTGYDTVDEISIPKEALALPAA